MKPVLASVLILVLLAGLIVLLTGPAGLEEPVGGEEAGDGRNSEIAAMGDLEGAGVAAGGAGGREALAPAPGVDGAAARDAAFDPNATAGLRLRLLDGGGQAAAGGVAWLGQGGPSPWDSPHSGTAFLMLGYAGFGSEDPPDPNAPRADVGADGVAVLTGLPVDETLDLRIGGAFWVQRKLTVSPLAPGEERDLGDFALAAGGRLHGRVEDPEGRPLAGALVQAQDPAGISPFQPVGRVFGETRSDADGRFALEGLPYAKVRLHARSPGFLEARVGPLVLGEREREVEHDVVLTRGMVLRGSVRDPDGRPVPGAHVLPRTTSAQAAFFVSGGLNTPQASVILENGQPTEPDGSFVLGGLNPAGGDRIAAAAPGFAAVQSGPLGAGDVVDLVLVPSAGIHGRVVDASGAPAPDVSVEARRMSEDMNAWGGPIPADASATTDDGGHFALVDLDPGVWRVEALSPAGRAVEDLELDAEGAELELALARGARLTVRVVGDWDTPVPEASVLVRPLSPHETAAPVDGADDISRIMEEMGRLQQRPAVHGDTNERGEAVFAGLEPGEHEIAVHAPRRISVKETITVEEGEDLEVSIELLRAASLLLTVVDPAEQPIPGATVHLHALDPDKGGESVWSQQTDLQGLARWSGRRPGRYVASIDGAGGDMGALATLGYVEFEEPLGEFGEPGNASSAPPEGLEVELLSGRLVRETLVVEELAVAEVQVLRFGSPVAGARVSLQPAGQESVHFAMFGGESGDATDGAGWVTLDPVPPGKYSLEARTGPDQPTTKLEVDLRSGVQSIPLELASGVVRGVAFGVNGPLTGAQVMLLPVHGDDDGANALSNVFLLSSPSAGGGFHSQVMSYVDGQASAYAAGDGSWSFDGVAAGRYRIRVRAEGHLPHDVAAFAHDGRAIHDLGLVQLEGGGSIQGRVIGLSDAGDGGFVGWIQLEVDRAPEGEEDPALAVLARENRYGIVGQDGRYGFDELPSGRYRLQLSTNGGASVTTDWIEVHSGPTVYDVTLP